jgi:hypothetical protein
VEKKTVLALAGQRNFDDVFLPSFPFFNSLIRASAVTSYCSWTFVTHSPARPLTHPLTLVLFIICFSPFTSSMQRKVSSDSFSYGEDPERGTIGPSQIRCHDDQGIMYSYKNLINLCIVRKL